MIWNLLPQLLRGQESKCQCQLCRAFPGSDRGETGCAGLWWEDLHGNVVLLESAAPLESCPSVQQRCSILSLLVPCPQLPLICKPSITKTPTPNPNPYQLPKLSPTIPIPCAWDTEDAGEQHGGSQWIQVTLSVQGRCCLFPRCPLRCPGSCSDPTGSNVLFLCLPGKSDIFVLETEPCKVI